MLPSVSLLTTSLRWKCGGFSSFNKQYINQLIVKTISGTAGNRGCSVDCKLRKSAETICWRGSRVHTSNSITTGKSRPWLSPRFQTTGNTIFTRSFASAASTTAGLLVPSLVTTTSIRNMSAKSKLKIVIFYGSTRQGRNVERVGEFVKATVASQGMEPIVMDPLKIPFEMLKIPLHFYPKPADAPAFLREENEKIKSADGFIILCAEYNAGIPPALANMMDHFPPPSFRHKPVGLVTYSMGTFGGMRAQVALRPFIAEIGSVAIPSCVSIPTVQNAFSEDGKCLEDRTSKNIVKLVQEVSWYATGLKNQKAATAPPS